MTDIEAANLARQALSLPYELRKSFLISLNDQDRVKVYDAMQRIRNKTVLQRTIDIVGNEIEVGDLVLKVAEQATVDSSRAFRINSIWKTLLSIVTLELSNGETVEARTVIRADAWQKK